MASPSLTILIPCLNEEVGVASVIREYAAAFPEAASVNASSEEQAFDFAFRSSVVLTVALGYSFR